MTRMQVLENLVRKHGWKYGAELGVYQGQTFFHLLDSILDLTMIGVDHWERTPGPVQDRNTGFASYENKPMEEYAEAVKKRAKYYGKRAAILHMTTKEAALLFDDGSLDFVFIDAAHDTLNVAQDINQWRPKVRPGGAVLGHDSNWPSVQRALDMAFKPEDVQYLDAHIWAVIDRVI